MKQIYDPFFFGARPIFSWLRFFSICTCLCLFTAASLEAQVLPIAADDGASVAKDGSVNIDVLQNDDFNTDGPGTSPISIFSPPTSGTAVVDDGGTPTDPTDDTIDYTPNPGHTGPDAFQYEICDSNGDCAQAEVRVTVEQVDIACLNNLNVSLGDDCTVTLSPDRLVFGDFGTIPIEDFSVIIEDLYGNVLDTEGVISGQGTFKYLISGSGVATPFCWAYITVEDKNPPSLECPPSISQVNGEDLLCADIATILLEGTHSYQVDKDGNVLQITEELKAILDLTGYAEASDNCAGLIVYVNDVLIQGEPCDDQTIERTFWIQHEIHGETITQTCTQEIDFTIPTLDDVVEPLDAELSCSIEYDLDENGNPHPSETGYPQVSTSIDDYDIDPQLCNLGASYIDGPRIQVCDGTYKIARNWQVVDWCVEGPERVRSFEQIIKVADTEGPTVDCVEVDYNNDGLADLRTYSTGPYDCTASFEVPLPEVSDECSSWTVLTEIVNGELLLASIPAGASRYVSGIPVGCHEIRYTVTDDCGNETIEYCLFQVLDQVAPIAVCDDDLNISLGGQSFARVTAEDIDEGSSDNCGPIRIEVRRRILDVNNYACLDMFDYDGDGDVIGDEVKESVQFGDPDGDGVEQLFYYTPWEPFADFNCCDMGEKVRIEMRVWDDANGSGIFGDEIELASCRYNFVRMDMVAVMDNPTRIVEDNYNVCWLDVLIEDKVPPSCIPPPNVELDCDELPHNFDPENQEQMTAMFGFAEGADNCPDWTVEELGVLTQAFNSCGSGFIVRRFRVTDAKGLKASVCEQVLTIHQVHDYWIKFPADAEANCGEPQVDTLMKSEGTCDLLAVSVKDETFSASGDECYKIFRTYSVINWCEYDGESDPVVVSRDEDCDGRPGDEAVYVIVKTQKDPDPCYDDLYGEEQEDHYEHVWYDRDSDPFNLIPAAGTKNVACDYTTNPFGFWKEIDPVTENEPVDDDTDGYPANGVQNCDIASVGYWQYTQVIKVYDTIKPQIITPVLDYFCSYSSDQTNGCPTEVNIDFQVDENCTPEDITITIELDADSDGVLDGDFTDLLSGVYPDYNVTGSFPLGKHELVIKVHDGCGNSAISRVPFEVKDCKAPTPICINGLAIELMPVIPAADVDGDGEEDQGAMAIWASDFIASPVTDCTGEVKYSINITGEEVDEAQTGLTLTCSSDANTLIQIWAWDGAGNGDHCETYILVQDNMVNCENAGGAIAGVIMTEEAEAVEGVMVELSGNSFHAMTTKVDGRYAVEELETGFDYTLSPKYNTLPLNGVSTFDMVLLSKHILGTQSLDSPYKRIAADVNGDQRITAKDAIALRRLILNIDPTFTNNTSWRFIPRDYVFPDPENPWAEAFPEVINIDDLQGALNEEDFVATKIGDLSLDAKANALMAEPRSTEGLFLLEVQEQNLQAGNTYQVDFRADQIKDIQGYQMTLSLDQSSLELADIKYGIATASNFGMRFVEEGLIATSWNKWGEPKEAYQEDEILFSLVINATKDAQLSEVLGVSSRVTPANAYDEHDGLMDVGIDFRTGVITKVPFELYQNVPNPFKEETMIGFYLPQDSETTLRIHDVSGRVIKLIRGEFAQGQNQVILKRNELTESGILFYTLTAGDYTATRKMILVK